MTPQRHVRLHFEHRTVTLPGDAGVVSYAGISVDRVEDGRLVELHWVPTGEDPSEADDEALLLAWHEAVRWSLEPVR